MARMETHIQMDVTVSRVDAVNIATEIVEKMGNLEDLNKRGYKIDGWRPMTGPERADAIVKIASFIVGPSRLLPPGYPDHSDDPDDPTPT